MDVLSFGLRSFRSILKKNSKKVNEENRMVSLCGGKFDYLPRALNDHFTVGFSKASILPSDISRKKYYIAGYKENNPAQGVLDAPYAHAVWIDDNSGRGGVVLVSIDDVGMLSSDVNRIRERLKKFSLVSGCRSINVVSTHNHAGIDTMGIWGPLPLSGKDPEYMELVFSTVEKCVKEAYASRQDGKLFKGTVEVEDMQEDIRLPIVYSKTLTRLRFVPENGGRETWIINFASHSESLQGCNSRVSADFPGYMRERILEQANADTLYCVGCIGGMISMDIPNEREIRDAGGDFAENTKMIGEKLADYALSIKEETELKPNISVIRQETYFEADNTILMLAAKVGIIDVKEYHSKKYASMGHLLKSEMTYFEIDSLKILLLPCELFPELAYGGYLSADESATGLSAEVNPVPLAELIGGDVIFVGLANDELGYVIPPNDFLLDETSPYAEVPKDRLGRRHYEETNSLGPRTADTIAECLKNMLLTVDRTKRLFE